MLMVNPIRQTAFEHHYSSVRKRTCHDHEQTAQNSREKKLMRTYIAKINFVSVITGHPGSKFTGRKLYK